ncbi:MAG TPA: BTAD domain-containing putative transcriptional regulator [Streptosporangiaceae bacterium]|nr:BTAD domain-containing putative transcriptional regulator [Streptosporangiaceae bacterium]
METQFGLLGPLYVRCGDAAFGVAAARQRIVLATLALRARQAVSFQELAKTIWDGSPSAKAQVTVRNYVSRLRYTLGPAGGRIVTCAPGYLLDAADDEVDALAFIRLCRYGAAALQRSEWQRAWDLLDSALSLWRGTPLADIPSRALRDEHVLVLESMRMQAIEWRLEAGLHLGRHSELLPELEALVREQPLRERFRVQLMLALYRCGRQGEALAAYRAIRQSLVGELGIEPGPDLQQLHQRILAADPALVLASRAGAAPDSRLSPDGASGLPGLPPHQMPASLRHFAGRTDELAALDRLLGEVGQPGGTVVISSIGGTAGIGKTALAVHWAHRVADRFPDGQLYVNLRGFDPSGTPVTPAEAVLDFLDALGTPPGRIPAQPGAQVALYRTLAAGKRLLILLDNAHDTDQVRPLLPGSPGCLVLVTSRATLTGLATADGARLLVLDRPSRSEARDLLTRRLGTGLMTAEPAAADELIGLCARLPLALSIAAARATARPGFPLAALVAELRDVSGRLEALEGESATSSLREVFSWSYRQLSGPAARLFRLLGMHPGPDISAAAAASLAGLPPRRGQAALRELALANLITERVPGRFAFHDLLRAYAAEQAEAQDPIQERRAATGQMLDHYLYATETAACALEPNQELVPHDPPRPGVTLEAIIGCDQALAWFYAEHKVLLAVIEQAAANRFDTCARLLPWMLVTFLDRAGRWQDIITTNHLALACSQRLDDLSGQARTHRNLARAHVRLGRLDLARAHLEQAIELYLRLADQVGEARAHLMAGVVYQGGDQFAESLRSSQRALDLAEATGHLELRATASNNVGYCYAMLGDFATALTYCRRALRLHRGLDSPSLEATTWDSLGYIYRHLDDHRQATRSYLRAVALWRDLGARYLHADALTNLGDTYRGAGDLESARSAWQQALTILDDLSHPRAGEVRARLQPPDLATACTHS